MPIKITAPTSSVTTGGALRDNALDIMLNSNVIRSASNGVTTFENIPADFDITLAHVQGIVFEGGNVEAWPHWFIVSDLNAQVPAFFEHSGVSWRDWMLPQWHAIEVDTGFAVPGDGRGAFQHGIIIAQITTECQVLNVHQYRTLIAQNIVLGGDGTA